MRNTKLKNLSIGVFTPFYQGNYIGEILNHLRACCEQKNYLFNAVRTDSFGKFPLAIGIDNFDAVIVIRNAVNPKLIEKIQNHNIPVTSIAHDYFPQEVPVIVSDNNIGIDLAVKHLRSRNHKKLAFIGDISHYDIRKRYERFSDIINAEAPPHDYNPLICVHDSHFGGGAEGAKEFTIRNEGTTGIICGSGYTAVGFIKQLELMGYASIDTIDVTTFDDMPIMKSLTPKLTRIDLNLDLVAKYAIQTVEKSVKGTHYLNETIFVNPNIRQANDPIHNYSSENSHLSESCTQTASFNSQVLIKNIIKSDLDQIMVLSYFYEQFMSFGFLSKLVVDDRQRQNLQIIKTFTKDGSSIIPKNNAEFRCSPDCFPPPGITEHFNDNYEGVFHFPILIEEDLWGFLSFYGNQQASREKSAFFGFTNTIDSICLLYGLTLQSRLEEDYYSTKPRFDQRHSFLPGTPSPAFELDIDRGEVSWNDLALDLLGFTTDLERSTYRSMSVFDRVHEDDQAALRGEISRSLSNMKPMTTVARVKNAEGHFQKFSFQGETTESDGGRTTLYKCVLSQIN